MEPRWTCVSFGVELMAPIAMENGLRFAIREGGGTVGAGVVSKIIEKGALVAPGCGRRFSMEKSAESNSVRKSRRPSLGAAFFL